MTRVTALRIGRRLYTSFVGSFGYEKIKTGFFEQKQFDIHPTSSPSESEVLQKVLTRMRKNNPEYRHAISMVEQRLAALQ